MNLFKSIFSGIGDLFKNKDTISLPQIDVEGGVPEETTPPSQQVATETEIKSIFFSIPEREEGCLSGSEFTKSILNINGQTRENLIFEECRKGNIPNFMRQPSEIQVASNGNILNYYVSPDVLCIGTDDDFVRVPLNPLTAQKICDLLGTALITRKISNQIWKAADIKLTPIPGGPPYDASMEATKKFWDHNIKIEQQRNSRFGLISGHKKDVIYSSQLFSHPNAVVIYGWFQNNGKPIQDLNPTSHNNKYCDYSHGIRLISRIVKINGELKDYYDILNDKNLSVLISDEGPYDAKRFYR